jgi:hypothetical protein
MKNLTAVEKLESMFYHRARPTINSNCWVITEQDFRSLILSAKAIEKEQIKNAFSRYEDDEDAEQYYNETYGKDSN